MENKKIPIPQTYSDSDDESATVMTGFNTEELFENRSMILDDAEEAEIERNSPRSVGKQVNAPIATNIPNLENHLEDISEGDESFEFDDPRSPEKRLLENFAVTPTSRFKSHPLGYKGYGLEVK